MDGVTLERTTVRTRRAVGTLAVARGAVSVSAAAFAVYWTAVGWGRWHNLQVGAFDFAYFDQIIWNTAQGRLFDTTFSPYNFAGQHFEPVLLAFAVAYRAGMPPWGLLVAQAVIAGSAALVLFEAGRALRVPLAVSAAAAAAYLANPFLHRALAFDFHPETMTALPAFAAVWAFATSRQRVGVACALSVLLYKEDTVFIVLALAVCAWVLGAHRAALWMSVTAVIWAVLTVGVLMPLVRGSEASDLVERYERVFGGESGVAGLVWAATHPLVLVRMLTEPAQLATLGTFIVSSGPWLLLAPVHAVALVPGLLLALLSSHGPQQALAFHYAAELVTVASIAGLFGARRLSRLVPNAVLTAGMVATTLMALMWQAPPAIAQASLPTAAHLAAVDRAVAAIPAGSAVSAQSNLAPRLARRQLIWEFPGQWTRAEWVVVDRYGFRSQQSLDAGFDRELAILASREGPVFEQDGVAVYRVTAQ